MRLFLSNWSLSRVLVQSPPESPKAYADLITIAGYDGGTGASPLTRQLNMQVAPRELGASRSTTSISCQQSAS